MVPDRCRLLLIRPKSKGITDKSFTSLGSLALLPSFCAQRDDDGLEQVLMVESCGAPCLIPQSNVPRLTGSSRP